MRLGEIVSVVSAIQLCENVYIDLDGTLKPHKFPTKGIYHFDGQVYYRKDIV